MRWGSSWGKDSLRLRSSDDQHQKINITRRPRSSENQLEQTKIRLSSKRPTVKMKNQGWSKAQHQKEVQGRSEKAKLLMWTIHKSTSKSQPLRSELLKSNLQKPKWSDLRMPTNESRLEANQLKQNNTSLIIFFFFTPKLDLTQKSKGPTRASLTSFLIFCGRSATQDLCD